MSEEARTMSANEAAVMRELTAVREELERVKGLHHLATEDAVLWRKSEGECCRENERLTTELESAKRREAAMREALYKCRRALPCYEDEVLKSGNQASEARWSIDLALSRLAGCDYLSKEQVRPLVESLEMIAGKHRIEGHLTAQQMEQRADYALQHARSLGL